VHFRACHICEALCGLRIETDGRQVMSIRPDDEDPFSRGHICPKGVAIQDIHEDPDRLRAPVKRTASGWETISWDEAFDTVVERLAGILERDGADAIGTYVGNPSAHSSALMTHPQQWFSMIGTRNKYSAGSVDTWPTQLVCYLMYGNQYYTPIPDIDRTGYMVIIGGNPMASNGSMMTVPGFPGRARELRSRGKLVVIDPRRTETAKIADEHHFVRPGGDAWLLLAMVHVLFRDGLVRLRHLDSRVAGLEALREAVRELTPALAEARCGVPAATIERLTHEFAASESAVMYGRLGTCAQDFGSVAQWAIQAINLLTGNLDREGGALLTQPAANLLQHDHAAGSHAAWHTRVSGLPEFAGGFPAAVMAEEMLTPGPGQVRGFITVAGNPVSGGPDAQQLDRALSKLEFMVSVDYYVNETTRHAHIILPPASPLERGHYDYLFLNWAVRNVTRYNEPVFEKPAGALHDYEIFNALMQHWARRMKRPAPALFNGEDMVERLLRKSSYPGLSLATLRAHPHGLDLGPLRPSLAGRLDQTQRRIDLAPPVLLDDLRRLSQQPAPRPDELLLIGRRHVRSNNSWMNNYHRLTKGKPHNQLLMHPQDMAARDLGDGMMAEVRSDIGEIRIAVKASEDLMPGVVCLPHGWGQGSRDGVRLSLASTLAGANFNDLSDARRYDRPSGNAVFNGIAVAVSAVVEAAPDDACASTRYRGPPAQMAI